MLHGKSILVPAIAAIAFLSAGDAQSQVRQESPAKPDGLVAAGTPVRDVRRFGAVGDGVHLDTAAIQKAIDACAGAGGGESAARTSVCLNGDWQRHSGGDGKGIPADGWETIRVPEAPDEVLEGSAWFRLDFEIPKEFAAEGQRVLIRFVRVRHYARVFLNGKECAENYGCRAPFEIDVTDIAKTGASNRLAVWVHNASGAYAMKGKTFADSDIETLKRLSTFEAYQKVATIAEDVFLVSRPALHVSDVLAMPSVRDKKLSVRITVRNDTKESGTAALGATVFQDGEKTLSLPGEDLSVPAGGEKTVVVSAPWKNPELWGFGEYGSPVLYHLETTLTDGKGEMRDQLLTRFGFRELWTEQDKIMLNGKPLRLLSYWQPEGSGRSLWTLRMASVQASGCNVIHNHAEQREPSFYDTADELGMLVWDADFCGGPLGTTANMITDRVFPDVQAELIRQYPMWAKAVANHPSAAIMMVGCLIHQDTNTATAATYRACDPTRLLQSNGGPATPPLNLGAYCSQFNMFDADPLGDIKNSYEVYGKDRGKRANGSIVPFVNSECWYQSGRKNPESGQWEHAAGADVAKATEEAIDWLGKTPLAGLNLYSQQCFSPLPAHEGGAPPPWPSRSGLSQHSITGRTGGLAFTGIDYVNYWNVTTEPWQATPAFAAQKRASKRFLGYEVPVAKTRRPTVLVKVTRGGTPAANTYVYAAPAKENVSNTVGMRADAAGTAWFELRDAGAWKFWVIENGKRKQVEVNAPLQPLDLSKGGIGPVIEARLDLAG